MKTSLKLNKRQSNSDGLHPLYVRIRGKSSKGKDSEVSIYSGIDLSPKQFSGGGISNKTPNYTDKNRRLNSILDNVERIISQTIEDGLEPNPQYVKKQFEDLQRQKQEITPDYTSFWKGFEEYFETKKHRSRGYVKTIITLRNRLEDFQNHRGTKITYDYVVNKTILFQNEFQNYLWSLEPPRTNGYINKTFENLRGFLHFSKELGYIEKKPKFQKLDTIDREEKIYLYKDEVFKLYNSTKWDFKKGKSFSKENIYIIEETLLGTRKNEFGGVLRVTNWELIKDVFLFMCSIGCRHSDIPFFRVKDFQFEKDKEFFTWTQQKTDSPVSVPVNFISGNIFKKYSGGKKLDQTLFPKLSNQKFNKGLKLLLEDLGFNRLVTYPKKVGSKTIDTDPKYLYQMISSHSGRRTFIKNMIDQGNMDYQTIMRMSGHKTISEFLKYVSVSPKDLEKGRGLYSPDEKSDDSMLKEVTDTFENLSKDNKRMVLQFMKSIENLK